MEIFNIQRSRRLVLVVILISIAMGTFARTGSGLAAQEQALQDTMKEMGKAHRRLRRQVADAQQRDESLELVRSIQRSSAAALGMQPTIADGLTPDKQAKIVLAYKRKQIELLTTLLDLEGALLSRDFERASALNKILGTIKKAGHENFQEKEF